MLQFVVIQLLITIFGCNGEVRKCGKVHLTVSSLEESYLEINWITKCDHPLDTKPNLIALFQKDPAGRDEYLTPIVKLRPELYPNGYHRTTIKFRDPWLPGNWEYQENITRVDSGPHCLPYWVASFNDRQMLHSQCLSIQPTWMSDNREKLGPQRLGSIPIPGTHNSGSYAGSFLSNYVLCQDRSVYDQLVFGVRYLDFRVGYYENDGFFINHDLVQVTRLIPVLRQVKRFLELAPSEIVILDFHRFPYPSDFGIDLHHKLISLVHHELGNFTLPLDLLQAGKGPTFNEIWSRGKNLIVCYATRDVARDYVWLWNPLQQYWADTTNVGVLKDYMQDKIKDHNTVFNPMWALMAELTPQFIDIVFGTNSIRKLADDVNRNVTVWFRDEWPNDANIVATDYFLGNDIINVAIEVINNR